MKVSTRFFLRTAAMIVGIATIAFSWACIERPMKTADPAPDVISDFSALQGTTRDVDLLFVIDNSLSMEAEQTLLISQFGELMRVLKQISGGLPNVHIGVTSTDLGTLPYNIPSCETPGGDAGALMKGENNACANPTGQNYIVDIEPANCNIVRDDPNDENLCTSNDCAASNCDVSNWANEDGASTEPSGLQLYTDENGCPRCRNYDGETLEDVFSCSARLGIAGCGFEQQLEAMYKVFGNQGANQGFYREDAYLAVFFITDEDDCSAKNSEIFNPEGGLSDTLGPLTSFRCTEFGIYCDSGDWQRIMPNGSATYQGCQSRPDTDARSMLYPVNRYVSYLLQLKDSDKIIAGAIAGPYENTLTVGVDRNQYPKLGYSCGEAVPGVRIKEFVQAFTPDAEDMNWAYTSVCSNDYTVALIGLGDKIRNLVEVQCITTPLNGCPDPAAANGFEPITQLEASVAESCVPACTVTDVLPDGSSDIIEQCPECTVENGCEGEEWGKRNNALPTEKCFYVRFNPKCAAGYELEGDNYTYGPSRGAEIIIARQDAAEPGTKAKITCQGFPLTEKLCNDGIDNDQDGLRDDEDPDCI